VAVATLLFGVSPAMADPFGQLSEFSTGNDRRHAPKTISHQQCRSAGKYGPENSSLGME
jgi:hypothetical protein